MNDAIWICEPDRCHNSYGVQIYSKDPEKIRRFREAAGPAFFGYDNPFGSFWQGQADDWVYIECWKSKQPGMLERIREAAERVAEHVGMPLLTEAQWKQLRASQT